MTKKLLTIASGHPVYEECESSRAPYELYRGYVKKLGQENVFYLGTFISPEGDGLIRQYGENEFFWSLAASDNSVHAISQIPKSAESFKKFILQIEPDVIHAHIDIAPELLDLIRHESPASRLIASLTELKLLCPRYGRMDRAPIGRLCRSLELAKCSVCEPTENTVERWLKQKRLIHYLNQADFLITASNFMQNLFLELGLSPDNLYTIPNAIRRHFPQNSPGNHRRKHFAYFGDVAPGKGIDILFQAFRSIPKEQRNDFILEIHGANLEKQSPDFQQQMSSYCQEFGSDGFLRWVGSYYPDEAEARMANIDWVLVPSTQWENSIPIIQQAFACGKPVIASDMETTAEYVVDHVNGLLVKMADPLQWSMVLQEVLDNDELWNRLHAGITRPQSPEELAERFIDLVDGTADPWDI